jgi:hypothetical protein
MTAMKGTLLVIGGTGNGKSELCNAYIQAKVFDARSDPNSVTQVTREEHTIVNGYTRCAIDTPGLEDYRGVDPEHVQQMVQFLRNYEDGVNAVALVFNGQSDRITLGTAKLIRLLHTFFNNPQFWQQVCIVFTKWYAGADLDKDTKETKFRPIVKDFAVKCGGESLKTIPLPVYFVDSKKWQTDVETAQELAALHAFVVGLPPLPTKHLAVPDREWFKIETETRSNQRVRVRDEIGPDQLIRIVTVQDQERERRTGYDGITISFSKWRAAREWEERETFKCEYEFVTEVVETHTTARFVEEHGRRWYFGVWGPRRNWQARAGTDIVTRYRIKRRPKAIGFDGKVIYGEWETVREWDEPEYVPNGQQPRAKHTGSTGPLAPDQIEVKPT